MHKGPPTSVIACMRAGLPLLALATCAVLGLQGCGESALQGPEAKPPTGLQPAIDPENVPSLTAPDPNGDPAAPSLDMLITKSMLYAAALKHGVDPYLVMGLAWHESGWQAGGVAAGGAGREIAAGGLPPAPRRAPPPENPNEIRLPPGRHRNRTDQPDYQP